MSPQRLGWLRALLRLTKTATWGSGGSYQRESVLWVHGHLEARESLARAGQGLGSVAGPVFREMSAEVTSAPMGAESALSIVGPDRTRWTLGLFPPYLEGRKRLWVCVQEGRVGTADSLWTLLMPPVLLGIWAGPSKFFFVLSRTG
jgi:hypothetical protein